MICIKLVTYVQRNTSIPVLGHADGLCSIYVDEKAALEKVVPIIVDAKVEPRTVKNASA